MLTLLPSLPLPSLPSTPYYNDITESSALDSENYIARIIGFYVNIKSYIHSI